jgi:2-octaprenyl-6-methoxyphenol hydroxylase
MEPSADERVIIVGGGHAGLLLALGLANRRITSTLIDASDPAEAASAAFDGRALALMYGSRLVIEQLGGWDAIRAFACPVRAVDVLDRSTGARLTYESAEVGEHPFAYGIENRLLRSCLLEAVRRDPQVELLAPARMAGLAVLADRVTVELADGRQRVGALAVGADGRTSQVRQAAQIRTEQRRYDQVALTFAVRHGEPAGERVREFLRPPGPLALLPIGPRLTSITWADQPARVARLADTTHDRLAQALVDEIGDVLGDLEVVGRPSAYPLAAHVARRFAAPRLALVSDAAHGLHPIHAQGFNLGVRDIGMLVELLAEARTLGRGLGDSEALARYARARQADAALTLAMTDGLARLFSNELEPAKLVRTLGLGALRHIAPLRRLAMRRGMGLNTAFA